MVIECTVPELGENIETATVVEVFVAVGDEVAIEQSVLSLETDKAEFEMPSNAAGKVSEILVKPGEDVRVGQAVLRLEGAAQAPGNVDKVATESAPGVPEAPSPDATAEDPPETARRETTSPPAVHSPGDETASSHESTTAPAAEGEEAMKPGGATAVSAAPAVRRLARELGVELSRVNGTGAAGRILQDDIKAYVRSVLESRKDVAPGASAVVQSKLPDFSKWGAVTVEPMSKVRRKTAEQMASAWNRIPHVTHYDAADITEMDRLRVRHSPPVEAAGGKLSMTAVLLKILASALLEFPKFNTSIDVETASIIYKEYIHLGVAVDTEKGLLVPVIRDVGAKTIPEIAMQLHALSEKARNRNIRPDELQGATFTLTNLGGIGGRAFSPLINPPEVAILGVSRARLEAEYIEGKFEPRLMMPLSVSYDHRVIDGADAARFMRWICEALQQPLVVNWEGA